MANQTPKLPLTSLEKAQLRQHKIKLSDIHMIDVVELADIMQSSKKRARLIKGLATFQKIPSIGYRLADTLTDNLGIYSIEELKNQDGAQLLNELEENLGYWVDPCVEDQLRCVIHHAHYPNSRKQWFDFTGERKRYRERYGYPESRPEKGWVEKS
ncbi:helix-hairpin-helix domain-containing protein [Salinibacillus xinjiangensis]|uniref:Pathogenicity locus n=1 Tax=Salinibacillus xinjiangensis TaxID=1229268 RepID=A0A6G1X9Z9_9BACI|nr:helix-hairpin-helix domain-containing protein [Salinibacillus xinjiangensis]MRG87841.1 Pathogenicity locus [Salinibacillus xinjiangensis]